MGSSWDYPEEALASSFGDGYPVPTSRSTAPVSLGSNGGELASPRSFERRDLDHNNNSQYILYQYLTSGSRVPPSSGHSNPHSGNQSQQLSPTSTTSQFAQVLQNGRNIFHSLHVKEIPSWNIYYGDQRQRDSLVEFSIPGNSIQPDQDLNKCVSICFNDVCITKLAVDAVVNSTTAHYSGERGVDKLIHEEAGVSLREACRSLRQLELGSAEITFGFNLSATWVIHTNGPSGNEDPHIYLRNCYENSLGLLLQYNLKTIAFPCISTGRKGVNREVAAKIALKTVRQFLERNRNKVDRVIFCLHNPTDIVIYRRFMQLYFPVI